jgi:hypothetical protein
MTGVMPFCIIASMMALEHGAQHVWSRTVVSPIGAWMLFFCFLDICISTLTKIDIFQATHHSQTQFPAQ